LLGHDDDLVGTLLYMSMRVRVGCVDGTHLSLNQPHTSSWLRVYKSNDYS